MMSVAWRKPIARSCEAAMLEEQPSRQTRMMGVSSGSLGLLV